MYISESVAVLFQQWHISLTWAITETIETNYAIVQNWSDPNSDWKCDTVFFLFFFNVWKHQVVTKSKKKKLNAKPITLLFVRAKVWDGRKENVHCCAKRKPHLSKLNTKMRFSPVLFVHMTHWKSPLVHLKPWNICIWTQISCTTMTEL